MVPRAGEGIKKTGSAMPSRTVLGRTLLTLGPGPVTPSSDAFLEEIPVLLLAHVREFVEEGHVVHVAVLTLSRPCRPPRHLDAVADDPEEFSRRPLLGRTRQTGWRWVHALGYFTRLHARGGVTGRTVLREMRGPRDDPLV